MTARWLGMPGSRRSSTARWVARRVRRRAKSAKSFAVPGESVALTAVLRFGARPMLRYTSRPVEGREPLLCGVEQMRCVRRDCGSERNEATGRLPMNFFYIFRNPIRS
jgi:hypothetical protein